MVSRDAKRDIEGGIVEFAPAESEDVFIEVSSRFGPPQDAVI